MEQDNILEIGIDDQDKLYIKPETYSFPFIYREAAEVHWNAEREVLYSPKPREWSYLMWYNHIIDIAKNSDGGGCKLLLTNKTQFINISEHLKEQILSTQL